MKTAPILIIDRIGLIGEPLSVRLSKGFPVVSINKWRRFPTIPDNKYSHIIVIDDEGEELEFLPKIIEKVRSINSELIFAKRLLSQEENIVGHVLGLYPSAKVVLYGDVFDSKLIHTQENFKSDINKFIYQAQRFGRIQIPGDGMRSTYPVFIADVVHGLVDLIFGLHKAQSLFYLFPKHPISELSLAHMIQKANPQVTIDFIRHDLKTGTIPYPAHGKFLLEDKYPLAKKIRAIDIRKNPPAGGENKQEISQQEKLKEAKHFPMFIIWILMFLIFSPLVFTLLFLYLGLNTLYFAKTQIDKGGFANVKNSLHLSNTFFYLSKKSSSVLLFQGKIVGLENNLTKLSDNIDSGYKISLALLEIFDAENYFAKVLKGESKNPFEDFINGNNNLKNAIIVLEKIRAEGKISAPFTQNLKSIDPLIKLISNTVDVLPSIFGPDGQRTYLLLFQNNMELRPGGGFIGSYGLLKLNMGQITDFSIHDVYDADGQLKGHVEPPYGIRRYIPSVHWYMRDSNFDVDFSKSASASSNFLNVETGEKADGVIGVDVSFVKNILHAIGPVYVPDYAETVSDTNLFELTEAHAEKNFFPGSTQKKDFLRSLYKAMEAKITEDNIPYFSIAQAISDSLVQKHLILAFNNSLQNIFTVNGWSSSVFDDRRESQNTINDFVGINEANLGVNKVNYFIKRKIDQSIRIESDGSLFGEEDLSYKNTSASWPGGDYKNYLRIILPQDAIISSISINGESQPLVDAITDPLIYEAKNFKAPTGVEIEKTNEQNKTIYGFLVDVPVGQLVKIKIQYAVGRKNTFDPNNFSYNLKIFKQPGIDDFPYSISLYYQDNLNVINPGGLEKGDGSLSYSENISGDKNLVVSFAKK